MEILENEIDFSKYTIVDGIVSASEKESLINFFSDINISIEEITSELERENHQKVVQVKYSFSNQEFITKPLYYKNILYAHSVKDVPGIIKYFEDQVFWLDIEKHDWPKPKGQTDIDNLIINDMTDDDNFKKYLKLFGNNLNMGNIQRITKEGRSNQYYRNLENNNHWHDLVILIQEFIKSNGENIDKKYFKQLVFKWDGNKNTERLRSSLSPYFGNRALIERLKENIKLHKSKNLLNKEIMKPKIDLLKYKKQIILQGPPGTGKTREAKLMAKQIIGIPEVINDSDIIKYVKNGIRVKTSAGLKYYIIEDLDIENRNILVLRESDTSDYTRFDDVIDAYLRKLWNEKIEQNSLRRAATIAKYIYDELIELKNSEQFKLLQFHPSYTYEDFVRGIVSKPNQDGGITYEAENNVLGDFAKKALDNYLDSNKTGEKLKKELTFLEKFNAFKIEVLEELSKGKYFKIPNTTAQISEIDESSIKFTFKSNPSYKASLLFSDFNKLDELNLDYKSSTDVRKVENELKRKSVETYYFHLYDLIKKRSEKINTAEVPQLKNYVLIIDEINRANLSSVLGELIYSLEYRGESVESMYAIEGDNKLILPPNLYIIGTMNTADRSVGHIDYAIRRRFAFVDVLPKDLSDEDGITFDQILFNQVAELFDRNLSPEFKKKDVQLGHSYFIDKSKQEDGVSMSMRLEYEIKPILLEYVKDGVLIGDNIEIIIDKLEASI